MRRAAPEHDLQRAIIAYLRACLPGAVVHHSSQGLDLRGKNVARAVAKAKWLGMAVGFPDLIVVHDGRVAFLEVKAARGRITEGQEAMREALGAQGFEVAVVRSLDDAWAAVERAGMTPCGLIGRGG